MCIAIFQPAGKELSKETLENCWRVNDDHTVDVWFPVEHDPLFLRLTELLQDRDLLESFHDLKAKLAASIDKAASIKMFP